MEHELDPRRVHQAIEKTAYNIYRNTGRDDAFLNWLEAEQRVMRDIDRVFGHQAKPIGTFEVKGDRE